MGYYSIKEIKLAAFEVMMESGTLCITAVPAFKALLEKLEKPEKTEAVTEITLAAVPEVKAAEPEPAEEAEPEEKEAPVFFGSKAGFKARIFEALRLSRMAGTSIPEICERSGGKLTHEDVLTMLSAGKVPYKKWTDLAEVLGVRWEEAS